MAEDLLLATDAGVVTVRSDAGKWDVTSSSLAGWSVTDVAVSPSGRAFAGTRGDGVWTSDDAGETWQRPNRGRKGPGKVQCVTVDPHNPERVYLGGPMKVITGYGGTSEMQAAVDRGELDGTPACDFSLVQGLFPEWLENDSIVPLYWWDIPISQEWLDALGATQPPNIFDIVSATQEQQDAFQVGEAAEDFIRMFILSDDTPPEILQAWRAAFKATVASPEFVEKAAVAGLNAGYGDPADLEPLLKRAESFTSEGRDFIKYLYGLD
ncbi:MAG: hypothetical protein O2884_00730 [Chloroflexi bacterium]|nr:hypothetical protein [Chloroflexota bacterium]